MPPLCAEPGARETLPYVIGVDVGGTKIRAAAALLNGIIAAEAQIPTNPEGSAVIRQLAELVDSVTSATALDRQNLLAVAIGVPGVHDPLTQQIHRIPNVPAFARPDGVGALTAALGVPTVFENDANAAAFGEWRTAGQDTGIMVAIALGTGIGMGVIADGVLMRGGHGAAGEIAELPFGPNVFAAAGNREGLESMVSTAGLLRTHRHLGGEAADGAQVIAAAQAGNQGAITAVRIYTRYVARAVLSVRAVLDPGRIVLTGGIGSNLYIVSCIGEWLALGGASPSLVTASVLGARAGVVGAAYLALDAVPQTRPPDPVAS